MQPLYIKQLMKSSPKDWNILANPLANDFSSGLFSAVNSELFDGLAEVYFPSSEPNMTMVSCKAGQHLIGKSMVWGTPLFAIHPEYIPCNSTSQRVLMKIVPSPNLRNPAKGNNHGTFSPGLLYTSKLVRWPTQFSSTCRRRQGA